MSDQFINIYNELHYLNLRKSTFTERKIFSPYTHNLVNDPTVIDTEEELPFMCCTMQNSTMMRSINVLLNGLSLDEYKLINIILDGVFELTTGWGLPTLPTSSLMRHLFQKRMLKKFFPDKKNILEIGPGSGYFSLLLALEHSGYCVFNTDVTQALYVYQHELYKKFNTLIELADYESDSLNDLVKLPPSVLKNKIVHIPWWKYKNLNSVRINVDVIVVNHAICEMHITAVQHLLSVAQSLNYPDFFMDSTGLLGVNLSFSQVISIFDDYGYTMEYSVNDLYIFSKKTSSVEDKFEKLTKVTNFNKENFYLNFGKKILRKMFNLFPFGRPIARELIRIYNEIYFSLSGYREFKRISKLVELDSADAMKTSQNSGIYFYDDISDIYQTKFGMNNVLSLDEVFLEKMSSKVN
jgi:hypothetical protein